MKLTKKKVFVTALVICLVAIISMGTLAWFSDTDSATNNFLVTDSDKTPNDVFSVDVTEKVANDGETPSDTTVDGYTFNNIIPGDELTKQPFVTNTGSYDQYIRVTVTVSDQAAFADALGEDFPVASAFVNINTTDLVLESSDIVNDNLVYVYYVNKIVNPNGSIRLFDGVIIPTDLTQQDVANEKLSDGVTANTLKDGFTIDIFAEAVQADNTVVNATNLNSVEAAREAFATVGM